VSSKKAKKSGSDCIIAAGLRGLALLPNDDVVRHFEKRVKLIS
jgi:hypothetical protein